MYIYVTGVTAELELTCHSEPLQLFFFFFFLKSNVIAFKCHRWGGVTVVTGLFFFYTLAVRKITHFFLNYYHSKGQMDFKANSLDIYFFVTYSLRVKINCCLMRSQSFFMNCTKVTFLSLGPEQSETKFLFDPLRGKTPPRWLNLLDVRITPQLP